MDYSIETPRMEEHKAMLLDLLLIGAGGLFMFIAIGLIMIMFNGGSAPYAPDNAPAAASLADLSGGKRIVQAPQGAVEISWLKQAGDIPVMVLFTADWCSYCRDLQPVLQDMTQTAGYELLLVEVDIDACPALAERYNIRGVPVVRAYVHGREIDRFTGSASSAEVADFIAGLPH
jgi:thioredoxin 1